MTIISWEEIKLARFAIPKFFRIPIYVSWLRSIGAEGWHIDFRFFELLRTFPMKARICYPWKWYSDREKSESENDRLKILRQEAGRCFVFSRRIWEDVYQEIKFKNVLFLFQLVAVLESVEKNQRDREKALNKIIKHHNLADPNYTSSPEFRQLLEESCSTVKNETQLYNIISDILTQLKSAKVRNTFFFCKCKWKDYLTNFFLEH